MLLYSAGSAIGAIGSTLVYEHGGWTAVCALGGGISLLALAYWRATERLLAARHVVDDDRSAGATATEATAAERCLSR